MGDPISRTTVVDNWSRQSPVLELGALMSRLTLGQALDPLLHGGPGPRSSILNIESASPAWPTRSPDPE